MAYRRRTWLDESGLRSRRQPAIGAQGEDDSTTDDDQTQSTPSEPTETTIPSSLLHPWLTDFGPSSLQRYLRAEIQRVRPRTANNISSRPRPGPRGQENEVASVVPSRHKSLVEDRKSLPTSHRTRQQNDASAVREAGLLSSTSSTTTAIDIPKTNTRRRRDSTDVEDELDASASVRAQPVRDVDLCSPTKRLALSKSPSNHSNPHKMQPSSSSSGYRRERPNSFISNDSAESPFSPSSGPRRSNRLREMGQKEALVDDEINTFNATGIAVRPKVTPGAASMSKTRLAADHSGSVSDSRLNCQTPMVTSPQSRRQERVHNSSSVLFGSDATLSQIGPDPVSQDGGLSVQEEEFSGNGRALTNAATLLCPVREAQIKHTKIGGSQSTHSLDVNNESILSPSLSQAEGSQDMTRSNIPSIGSLDDGPYQFDYSRHVPEYPLGGGVSQAPLIPTGRSPRKTISSVGSMHDAIGNSPSSRTTRLSPPAMLSSRLASSSTSQYNTADALSSRSAALPSHRPSTAVAKDLPRRRRDPPFCGISRKGKGWSANFSSDEIGLVCRWLSVEDVHQLRLVNKKFAEMIAPILFKRVVVPFNKEFFNPGRELWNSKFSALPSSNPVRKYGKEISKFAISFEVDLYGLATAQPKHLQHDIKAWWGGFSWPRPAYPRFQPLRVLEDSLDSNRMHLRETFKSLSGVTELGLSIDSGHGWLNGPDVSDMAVFDMRCEGLGKVFGKTFRGENKWHEFGRDQLFSWAQLKTLSETMKETLANSTPAETRRLRPKFDRWFITRERTGFVHQSHPDSQPLMHTGGVQSQPVANANQAIPAGGQAPHGAPAVQGLQNNAAQALNIVANHQVGAVGHRRSPPVRASSRLPAHAVELPQWPIIFNGFNVSAGAGGTSRRVQSRLASPSEFPLKPGELTEAQVQWLLETFWAQRTFLSAFVTAVITNKPSLSGVSSLCLAKLSSGLLPSLAHNEFWSALPALKTVTILVSPDWRREHTPGDRAFSINMPISPLEASAKLTELLGSYICPLERLTKLVVGFVGGGEHATGICARNKHVLPAPITTRPRDWTTDHKFAPSHSTLIKFDHIKDLKFENCWFSPCMLKNFMERSADTSLRHLTLESVSLTGVHSQRTDGPMTAHDAPKPRHGAAEWLHERLPHDGCWPDILDNITPGPTLFERKITAGIVDCMSTEALHYARGFRGHVQKITLKSCGYAKISGVNPNEFNQNGLVVHRDSDRGTIMDNGLSGRKMSLQSELVHYDDQRPQQHPQPPGNANQLPPILGPHGIAGFRAAHRAQLRADRQWRSESRGSPIMMNIKDPATGSYYFGLGKLTQAVTPVEKRILEQAWGLTFGWGNTLDRFKAVEDGCLEGGTGRFSGVITVAENNASGIQYGENPK